MTTTFLRQNPLDFDDTVLNAIDLDKLENVAIKNVVKEPKRNPQNTPPTSTAKRKKRNFRPNVTVLDMTVYEDEVQKIDKEPDYKDLLNDSHSFWSIPAGQKVEEIVDNYDEIPSGQQPKPNLNEHIDSAWKNEDEIFSSQALFNEVEKVADVSVTKMTLAPNLDDSLTHVNCIIGSQYIRRERLLAEANEANIIDEEIDVELGENYNNSQYRREMDQVFNQCEKTICNMSNLNEFADGLEEINWDDDITHAGNRPANRTSIQNIFQKSPPPLSANKNGPVSSSSFFNKGPFFGLPVQVKHLLKEYRGITELYDWQIECLKLPAIEQRLNLIYALPTSGGKTLVAEILMLREIICRQKNVMFVVPYVSLAQEKMSSFSAFAVALNFLVEEYSGGKGSCPPRKRRKKNSVFICTIEKGMVLLDSLIENDRANEIGLIIVDELHMIGEENRGVHLENLLSKIMYIKAGIQVVGMSATIGNLSELSKFLNADVYNRDFRPVELREFVKCGADIVEINKCANNMGEIFLNKNTIDYGYDTERQRLDPDHINALVMEVIPQSSCLIFCATKKQCEALCALLTQQLPKCLLEHKTNEKRELYCLITAEGFSNATLANGIKFGIAYHHSGLTGEERRLIEDAYRIGVLSLIICTSTLAAGVNLPAKRVIIRSPYIAANFLTLGRYKQMVGRAGRTGFGENGESILICPSKDVQAVCKLLCSPMDCATSTLHCGDSLKQLILSAIGLNIATTRNELVKFISKTLMAIQADRLLLEIKPLVDIAIAFLYKSNAIKAKTDKCLKTPLNMTIRIDSADTTQEIEPKSAELSNVTVQREVISGKLMKNVKKNTKLEVNRLGKAAIRAGFSMEKACRYYDELKVAGQNLNVLDELHLLYIILLYDNNEIRIREDECASLISTLSQKNLDIAERFHVSQVTLNKIMGQRTVPFQKRGVIQRFFRLLIVYDLWCMKTTREVAMHYKVDPGAVQALINNTAATASSILRMCEELEELWAFKQLFSLMPQRLSHCCTAELLPLMELPAVKITRAKQLYKAGYTKLQSIAKATPKDLTERIEHLSYRAAIQIIASAKAKLMEEVEALKEQVEDLYFG